ncbi:MAG: hypothetical protein Q6367_016475 [Candidatus Freyarchaeota archaeon]
MSLNVVTTVRRVRGLHPSKPTQSNSNYLKPESYLTLPVSNLTSLKGVTSNRIAYIKILIVEIIRDSQNEKYSD